MKSEKIKNSLTYKVSKAIIETTIAMIAIGSYFVGGSFIARMAHWRDVLSGEKKK